MAGTNAYKPDDGEYVNLRSGETHGGRTDIDENTPLDAVKAPNIFERAKEEIEAIVQAIYHKESNSLLQTSDANTKREGKSKKATEPNLVRRGWDEMESILHNKGSGGIHSKETHGRSNDIDAETGVEQVKGPSVLERAKEEIEAIVDVVHRKKEARGSEVASPDEQQGFGCCLGMGLEKICHP